MGLVLCPLRTDPRAWLQYLLDFVSTIGEVIQISTSVMFSCKPPHSSPLHRMNCTSWLQNHDSYRDRSNVR